jgi:phosphoribosyl 1,2-cyclic phosphate phosphodiesterase
MSPSGIVQATFLGTGTSQGVPVIACDCPVCLSPDFRDKRTRSSVYVVAAGQHIAIDTGPDFRQQLLRERVRELDAVLFTHAHKDHTAGLDDIRPLYFQRRNRTGHGDMPIYGTPPVIGQLRQEFAYIFAEVKYPGVPGVEVHEIGKDEPFHIGELPITPIEVMHHRLPVLGFRIGNFTYITDANHIAPEEIDKIRGSEILVINALHRAEHISHFNLEQALRMVEEIAPQQAYFTHISHQMGLHADVMRELPPGVALAYDGLTVQASLA